MILNVCVVDCFKVCVYNCVYVLVGNETRKGIMREEKELGGGKERKWVVCEGKPERETLGQKSNSLTGE